MATAMKTPATSASSLPMTCTQNLYSRKYSTYCSLFCQTSTKIEQLSNNPAKHARKGGLEGRGWREMTCGQLTPFHTHGLIESVYPG